MNSVYFIQGLGQTYSYIGTEDDLAAEVARLAKKTGYRASAFDVYRAVTPNNAVEIEDILTDELLDKAETLVRNG